MVNPGVDGYAKTPNQRKILRKTQKKTTPYEQPVKRILKLKYKLSGWWFSHLTGQGSQIGPLPSRQLLHCRKHFEILIKQK